MCTDVVQDGRTAVHLAAMNGHHDVLKKLLLFGVEVADRDMVGVLTDTVPSIRSSL